MLNKLKTVSRDIRVNRGGRRANRPTEFAPLIFRRWRGATIIQQHQWHRPVFLRLEIAAPTRLQLAVIGQGAQPSTLTVVQQVRRREEIIERIVRRQIRSEASSASPDAMVQSQPLTAVGPPPVLPPLILRTPPALPVAASVAPAATVDADLSKLPPRPATQDRDAIDINRLTEQVVTAIDRRISAWRERTGRH